MVSLSLSAEFLFNRNNRNKPNGKSFGVSGSVCLCFCPQKSRLVQSLLWLLCWCESLCLWTETSGLQVTVSVWDTPGPPGAWSLGLGSW